MVSGQSPRESLAEIVVQGSNSVCMEEILWDRERRTVWDACGMCLIVSRLSFYLILVRLLPIIDIPSSLRGYANLPCLPRTNFELTGRPTITVTDLVSLWQAGSRTSIGTQDSLSRAERYRAAETRARRHVKLRGLSPAPPRFRQPRPHLRDRA